MTIRALFTGYAPVHYLCFRPLHEAMRTMPEVEIFVSGGLRRKDAERHWVFDAAGLYAPLGVAPEEVLTVEEIAQRDFDLLLCANTREIRPRHAERTIEIFHGVSFRNLSVREANAGKDAYFVVGPYMRRAMRAHGLLPDGDPRAVAVGFPKTDRLLDGALDRAAILAAEGLSGDRPVVLYAPTGATHNSLETMGEDVLAALRDTEAFDVLVKLHDHPKSAIDWRARLAPFEDDHLRVTRRPDVVECLFAADLLLSDASSVSNEFSLLDRPMVFLDVPRLLAEARDRDRSTLDLDTWGRRGGEVVAVPGDAPRAIADALEHPERRGEVRRAMAADLFYNPGCATDAAVRWLSAQMAIAA